MGAKAHHDDDAVDADGHVPERTCAVTREKLDPERLIRFVAAPDGTIVPDLAGKLPGRGVWVGNSAETVAEAARSNCFARSLKRKVIVPQGLAEQVEALMRKRAVEALALANKAGLVTTGFTKVDIAVGRGEAHVLIHAAEAADDGRSKLDRKFRAVLADLPEESRAKQQPRIIADLGSDELSLATGRPNVVHAALSRGGAAERFLREAERLMRYRSNTHSRAVEPPAAGLDTERV